MASVARLEVGRQVIVETIGTSHLFVTTIFAQVTAKILVKMEAIVTKTNVSVSNKFSHRKLTKKMSLQLLPLILKILLRLSF